MKHHLLLLLVVAACGDTTAGGGSPDNVPGPTPTAQAAPATNRAAFEARSVYQSICATCHGPSGKGDGQAAAGLDPKPRNYTDKTWQSSVTDEDLRRIIMYGGAAVGKSAVMPGAPQLKSQPAVIDELVKIIRGFGS